MKYSKTVDEFILKNEMHREMLIVLRDIIRTTGMEETRKRRLDKVAKIIFSKIFPFSLIEKKILFFYIFFQII